MSCFSVYALKGNIWFKSEFHKTIWILVYWVMMHVILQIVTSVLVERTTTILVTICKAAWHNSEDQDPNFYFCEDLKLCCLVSFLWGDVCDFVFPFVTVEQIG
jgi:hypothetical protein